MSTPELVTLLDRRVVGVVQQTQRGQLRFTYDDAWRASPQAYPLSLSMPLQDREHGDDAAGPYLEGLLPDNDRVLARWAAQFRVSPRNPFALLAHVGEDCPGAVQFCRPERVPDLQADAGAPVRWLAEDEVAALLRELRTENATGRVAGDPGYFSLPGVQPKTALLFQDGCWGVPSGRTPTTHILKPPLGDLEGFAENEHLCLRLAASLGLATTRSTVERFQDETAIVVERYDRVPVGGRITRIHQEDFCQVLGISPRVKYEAEGGPGVAAMARVLRRASSARDEDLDTLLCSLALNWAIGGTDAHAKNYSVLIGPGQVRLAPLYDIASILPYPRRVPIQKASLAMRIGREYRIRRIERRHWERLGEEMGLGADVVDRVRQVVRAVPERMEEACAAARAAGIIHPVADVLRDAIRRNAAACLAALERRGTEPSAG